MNKTSIEWCNRPETRGPAGAMTWNPIRARLKGASPKARSGTFCTRISPGCTHCYASTINKRFGNGLEFTVPNLEKVEFFLDDRLLDEPRRQRKPCTIFVGDMFDLFHEAIPTDLIVDVFRAMCVSDLRHTFQVLTKRAARMKEFFLGWNSYTRDWGPLYPYTWPRPNIWLGTSVESQQYADERIPLLLQTPAAVRFLSMEPQLEEVRIGKYLVTYYIPGPIERHISWVICGGESGPGARPFNLAWAESLLAQCRAAGVPFFMKQMGSVPMVTDDAWRAGPGIRLLSARNHRKVPDRCVPLAMRDRKGGDPSEWPESLRVREFPASQKAEVVSA